MVLCMRPGQEAGLYLNWIGSYSQKMLITQKNSCDVSCDVTQSPKCTNKVERHDSRTSEQYLMCRSSDYLIYVAKWAILVFPNRLIMGEVSWLTWSQMTCIKKSRICNMWVPWALLLSESYIFLRKIVYHWQHCKIATFCDRADVYLWVMTS